MSKPEDIAKLLTEPAGTLAEDVIEFFGIAGMPVTRWQREVLTRVFAETPDGKVAERSIRLPAASEGELTAVLACAVIAWLFLCREQLVLWSVSNRDAERAAFDAVMTMIAGSSLLAPKVQRARRTAGDREVRLLPHGSPHRLTYPRLLVRRRQGSRGVSASRLIVSQAEDFGDEDAWMLLPVVAGAPDPQLLWCSAVPPSSWRNTALGAE